MLWQRNRIIAVVLLLILLALGLFMTKQENEPQLVQSSISQATSLPSPTPQEIKYDSSTDLNKELETVNPQVLESDFTDSGL